jgi:beta-lactamase regulating signal transducer with metallopeptidase domain
MSSFIVEAALKITLLIAGAAVLNLALRRRISAAARHLIWSFVFTGLALLPLFLVALPRWEVPLPILASTTPIDAPIPSRSTPRAGVSGDISSGVTYPVDIDVPSTPVTRSLSPSAVVLTVYVMGFCLVVARLARQRWLVHQVASTSAELRDVQWVRLFEQCAERLGVQTTVRLLRSRVETVPMAFGIRVPTIVVPALADTWDEERQRAVLLHELAHIARRDCLTQTLASAVCALYWLHPGVWWMARRLRDESESACDDRVVAAGTSATDYAEHLLELAYACGGQQAPALALSMARPNEIEGRLRAILDTARNRRPPAVYTVASVGLIAAAILAALAAARATTVPVDAQSVGDLPSASTSSRVPAREEAQVDQGAIEIAAGRPGTWEMRMSGNGDAEFRLSDRSGSWRTLRTLFDSPDMQAPVEGNTWRFNLQTDAGTFALEGVTKMSAPKTGVGAGTFTFIPSETFPSGLVKRGFARPTVVDQYVLARSGIGFGFIDELAAQGYTRPDLPLLVRAAEHGVGLPHVREMGRLGYRLGQLDALITQVDHGVTPEFVRELRVEGLSGLSARDLQRARDHGVDPEYIRDMKALGFVGLTLDDLVRTRDHGVDPTYTREMRQLGYRLSLEDLVKARDHGVDPTYANEMATLGFAKLPIEALIFARDHGVDPDYVRELRQLGYQPALDELIRARDHGVDPEYIRAMGAAGYTGLTLEQLIRLRDHGVDADYARQMKTVAGDPPTPDALVQLRDNGVTTDRASDLLSRKLGLLDRKLGQLRWHVDRFFDRMMN